MTILLAILLLLAVVVLGVISRRAHRQIIAKMTPEEIKQYDEETEVWLQTYSM